MVTRIQVRRGAKVEWESVNPILASGEIGFEYDTGAIKIGDGSTAWNQLDPVSSALLEQKENKFEKGVPLGYAALDAGGVVPDGQLPVGLTRDSELETRINQVVNSMLDGAPSALNTLNELAAALGDDPNFATTVTEQIASKQDASATLDSLSALTTTAFGRSLLQLVSSAAGRQALGLVIGQDVQAYSPILASTTAAYTTGHDSKLSTIEVGATADQTALEVPIDDVSSLFAADNVEDALQELSTTINTVYDNSISLVDVRDDIGTRSLTFTGEFNKTYNATTGITSVSLVSPFSPEEKSKLTTVEIGATADQTPAELLTAIKTVDGAGSGLDADLLEGQHGTYFRARSNHTGTQLSSTISDFAEATQDIVATALGALEPQMSSGINVTYNDTTGRIYISYTPPPQGALTHTDISDWTEAVQDTMATTIAGNGISVDYDDIAGTITLSAAPGEINWIQSIADTPTLNLDVSGGVLSGTVTVTADQVSTTGTTNKFVTQAQIDKLAGIEAGATGDQTAAEVPITDAANRYTGTNVEAALQEAGASIATLNSAGYTTLEAVQDSLGGSFLVAGTNITKTYNDASNTLTIGVNSSAFEPAGTVATHAALTQNVHGISNTANLVYTDDFRLSNPRTPTTHGTTHSEGGSDPIAIARTQVNGLNDALNSKIEVTAIGATIPSLVDGVIPTSQLPSISILDRVVVANASARLSLTSAAVQPGDVAIQSDTGTTWLLVDTDPALAASWKAIDQSDAVQSVNGQTGTVVLSASDVGAATAAQGTLASTALQPSAIGSSVQAFSSVLQGTTASYTTAEKTKLSGIQTGAQVNVATNLGYTASTRVLTSSTGTSITLPEATTTVPGLSSAADKTKLNGIETGATADQTAAEILAKLLTVDGPGSGLDADTIDGVQLADITGGQESIFHQANAATPRPNSDGSVIWIGSVQPTNWIVGDVWIETAASEAFSGGGLNSEDMQDNISTFIIAGTGIAKVYDDAANTLTLSAAFDATAPVALTPDIAGSAGTSTAPARRDHVHNVSAAAAVGLSATTTNAEGDSTSFARANHTHAITGFLPLTGGTLTGALTLSGAPTVDLHAATKLYVDQSVAGATNLETVQDNLGTTFIVAGAGISKTYDDAANTLTIASTVTPGPSLEEVQDNLGNTFIVAGAGITKTYDDAAGTLTLSATATGSTNPLQMVGNQVKLVYISANARWEFPNGTVPTLTGRTASITWEGTAAQIPAQGTGDASFRVGDTALIRSDSL